MYDYLYGDYQSVQVKELVVLILLLEKRPLRQVEIELLMKKHFPKKVMKSSGQMSLVVNELVKSRILVKKKPDYKIGVRKNISVYYLNPHYTSYKEHLFHSYNEHSKEIEHISSEKPTLETVHARDVLDRPFSEYKFKTLSAADQFCRDVELYLIKQRLLDDPRIIKELLWNRLWLYPEERAKEYEQLVLYLLVRSHFDLNYKKSGFLKGKQVLVRAGIERISDVESSVFVTKESGLVSVEVYPPVTFLEKLADLFETKEVVLEREFKQRTRELLTMQGEFLVSVKTRDVLLQKRREHMFNNFKKVFFNDMIDSMVDQIKAGKEVITLSDEFRYMTPEQAAITRETLQLTDFDDITPVMSQIKNFCKLNLSSDKPVVIIDLGVGPAIKPVTLYTSLLKDFDVGAYVGVDASEHLLALAKQDIERYRFDLRTEFLHLNFRQITKEPSELLDKLPEGQKVFLLLGGTYGNFEQKEMLEFLRSFMKKGDVLIVGADEIANKEEFLTRIYPRYQDKDFVQQKKHFHFLPLAELGFREDELEYGVYWDNASHTQYTLWTIKKVSERLIPQLVQAGIREGHKIRPWMCHKPTLQQFKKELESIGLYGEVHSVEKGQANLALMKLTK